MKITLHSFIFILTSGFAFGGLTGSEDDVTLTQATSSSMVRHDPDQPSSSTSRAIALANRLGVPIADPNEESKQQRKEKIVNQRRDYEQEILREYQILPEHDADKEAMLAKFVDKYFHMYECHLADDYFKNGQRTWSSGNNYMTLRLTQSRSDIFNLRVDWVVHDRSYFSMPSNFKTNLIVKFKKNSFDDVGFKSDTAVALVPADAENQFHVVTISRDKARKIHELNLPAIKVKMMDGKKELAQLTVPFSELKFSFHSGDWMDQKKGKCCYRERLADLHLQETISREFFNYARDNMANYCVVPNGVRPAPKASLLKNMIGKIERKIERKIDEKKRESKPKYYDFDDDWYY